MLVTAAVANIGPIESAPAQPVYAVADVSQATVSTLQSELSSLELGLAEAHAYVLNYVRIVSIAFIRVVIA